MKTATFATPFVALATLALVSCDNPADKTADATVTEAVEKTEEAAPESAVRYTFTENSKIGFVGSKVTGSHEGGFEKFTGHFTLVDGKPVGNDHKVEIDMTSTWSDNEKLTGHLKAPDFFDVEKFPTSTFDVTSIAEEGDGYTVTGNFTLHGVTKSISFPATVTQTGDVAKIQAEFDINRFDFDIKYPGRTDDLIRKEVVIKLDLEAKAA
ncbi:MAG: YceI family protein [Verrucomicrobiota bacterium]